MLHGTSAACIFPTYEGYIMALVFGEERESRIYSREALINEASRSFEKSILDSCIRLQA